LVDFFSPQQICDRVIEALDNPDKMAIIRQNARQTILDRYDLAKLLPQHLEWMSLISTPFQIPLKDFRGCDGVATKSRFKG
jgi:hypothetical protein